MPSDLRRPERTFTIRQLCLEFKCTPRALRFYEDKGLLSPARQGLNRVYSYKDRARLVIILRGKHVRLSLAEIRDILELYEKGDGGLAQDAYAVRKFGERIIALEKQRADLDSAINDLYVGRARLEEKLAKIRPDLLPDADDRQKTSASRIDAHREALGAK